MFPCSSVCQVFPVMDALLNTFVVQSIAEHCVMPYFSVFAFIWFLVLILLIHLMAAFFSLLF